MCPGKTMEPMRPLTMMEKLIFPVEFWQVPVLLEMLQTISSSVQGVICTTV